jgi:hypothetical protein
VTVLLSTDHKLIPSRNARPATMQGSASGSNVRYNPTWKHSPFIEMNKAWTGPMLQLDYESLRLLIADQYEIFRPPARFVLPPHCTKDVHIPQGSTRDLWTVCTPEDYCLLGRCAVYSGSNWPTFQKFLMPPLSLSWQRQYTSLKRRSLTIRLHCANVLEGLHTRRRENLKSHVSSTLFCNERCPRNSMALADSWDTATHLYCWDEFVY